MGQELNNRALLIIEAMIENSETSDDLNDLYEQVQFYIKHPVNINSSDLDDLYKIPCISPIKIQSIIVHRSLYGPVKNKYELLWDQRSPEGYLKLCAVLQKYIDQGISVNTSYNPRFYDDEKIPMSEMLQHLIMCYKYGTKQLYYFNTNDGQGEIDVDKLSAPLAELADDAECDSCVI
jgi:ribonucleotide reductase alpha subunit